MKKKGIYVTSYDLKNQSDGVSKKITYQIDCLEKNGFEVIKCDLNSVPYTFKTTIGKAFEKVFGYSYISTYLLENLAENFLDKVEFIYIRKDFCNKKQIDALKKIRKKNPQIKILVEYPTYPYDDEIRGRRKYFALPIDKRNREKMQSLINRTVTFSNDEKLFGTQCLNISNAIDYDKVKIREIKKHEGINLIAVALFGKFHGYDRLIRAMGEDIQLVREYNVYFHLVGEGYALKEYRKLVKKYRLEERVIFHGRLCGFDLDEVYSIADIAIDNMGRHRVGCFYNSSLKGKEYGAKGLPIISGVETDLDKYGENFYCRVPADESLIDIKGIIDFYENVYKQQNAIDVARSIRTKTSNYFSFNIAFKPVIEYIMN